MLSPTVSIVVPVYRSQECLSELVSRLCKVLTACTSDYEIILVNDGSPDRSWGIIAKLASQDPRIKGINLMRNSGQHNAILAGIRAATQAIIVTIDDDLQNPPEEIPALLSALTEQWDVVYGAPQVLQHGWFRNAASQITKIALQSSMGVQTARKVSAFRAFRTDLRRGFEHFGGPFVSVDVLLTWSTNRFTSIQVRHDPRAAGVSNYTLGKLINHAVNMITGFSVAPLRFASVVGFSFATFGAAVLVYVLSRYVILGYSVPGFPFLASITAIFSGAQLFALGIIGEYLSRLHFRIMERPTYVIRNTTTDYEH